MSMQLFSLSRAVFEVFHHLHLIPESKHWVDTVGFLVNTSIK